MFGGSWHTAAWLIDQHTAAPQPSVQLRDYHDWPRTPGISCNYYKVESAWQYGRKMHTRTCIETLVHCDDERGRHSRLISLCLRLARRGNGPSHRRLRSSTVTSRGGRAGESRQRSSNACRCCWRKGHTGQSNENARTGRERNHRRHQRRCQKVELLHGHTSRQPMLPSEK